MPHQVLGALHTLRTLRIGSGGPVTTDFFLQFILFWAFPPSANRFLLVTESSVLKWGQLIVFKAML